MKLCPTCAQPELTIYSRNDWSRIASDWEHLSLQSGASFFLSNAWVETWLEIFGEQLDPEILLFKREGQAVGACLLVRRLFWRKFVPLRRVFLNCTGEDEADSTYVEYNRLMCLPGHEDAVAQALREHLQQGAWDELLLAGLELGHATESLQHGAYRLESTQELCWYIDLAALRNSNASYDSAISANSRQQIRRSIRLSEETFGVLSLQQAGSEAEAIQLFEKLVELHQQSWKARDKGGAFASEKFLRFHRRLIQRSFASGGVHLLGVTAGTHVIGVLYSFFYRNRIYFYQSGFAYQEEKHEKPGLVTHFLAIKHYMDRPDVLEYDFLAGDSQYKRSLAKASRTLDWIVVQQPTWRVKLVEALRALKRRHVEPS